MLKPEEICSLYKQQSDVNPLSIPVFSKEDEKMRLSQIYSTAIEPNDSVEWQLIILTSGYMPQLGMEFVETKEYHSSKIRFEETLEIETKFDLETNTMQSIEWDKF